TSWFRPRTRPKASALRSTRSLAREDLDSATRWRSPVGCSSAPCASSPKSSSPAPSGAWPRSVRRWRCAASQRATTSRSKTQSIHAPVSGRIRGYTYLPGALFPVNAAAVAHVDQLFAKNERLITHIESDRFGKVEVVKVGATCVGHIKVAYDSSVKTNVGARE